MNTTRRFRPFPELVIGAILTLALLGGNACAEDVSSVSRSVPGAVPEFHPELGLGALQGYLLAVDVPNSLLLIPRPPEPGSAAFANDLDIAERTFALRGTPRFALAEADFDLKITSLVRDFSCALNAQVTQENAPFLFTMLSRSFSDLGSSTYAAKNYYERERPFQINQQPLGVPAYRDALSNDPSYPSGHTAIGWGMALILAELAPDRALEILDRGRAYGESRIVVNHHWFSDVVWGRFMGAATVALLHANPTFRGDMDAATQEIAALTSADRPQMADCKSEAAALAMGFQASDVTAIDILLTPDATLLAQAQANNDRLLDVFPAGFALDEAHTPHTTLIQRFVRTADLEKVYAAAGAVLAKTSADDLQLEASKFYYIPSGDVGLAGIVAKPTQELINLQADIITAVAPYTVETGDSAAFFTTADDPMIDPFLIAYVSAFVPESSGEKMNPHVTTGVAPRTYLDQMLAEPFEPFTFLPAGAAVYQLGQFGTAAKQLKALSLAE